MNMLSLIILTPLIGALISNLLKIFDFFRINHLKVIILICSWVTFTLSIYIWVIFDNEVVGYQFVSFTEAGFVQIQLGIDGISLYFVLLTSFLTPICLLASWNNITHNHITYFSVQLVISSLLISVFLVIDLILFYVAFESVLIPLFFVVGLWGGSNTRIRSAYLLFLYTLAGSLFILLGIVTLYSGTGQTDFISLSQINIDPNWQKIIFLSFFIALAVKTPLVPFHIWLPRAHADAPLAGSIVLAGTVLKLATYGYLRLILPILPDACDHFTPLVQVIAIISLIYSSLATIRQVDFKALVAYSSVSHIAIVVLGLFSNNIIGIEGAIVLSLAHGVISPALFVLVGGVIYDRFHTRVIRYYRGIAQMIPIFSLWFFLAICCNIGVPLSLNWVSEFIALSGVITISPIAAIFGASGIVLSACYSIWLWGRIIAGEYSIHLTYNIDVNRRENIILFSLILPAIYFGIWPDIILDSLHSSVNNLLYIHNSSLDPRSHFIISSSLHLSISSSLPLIFSCFHHLIISSLHFFSSFGHLFSCFHHLFLSSFIPFFSSFDHFFSLIHLFVSSIKYIKNERWVQSSFNQSLPLYSNNNINLTIRISILFNSLLLFSLS